MRYAIWLALALSATGCYGQRSLGEGQEQTTVASPEVKRELLDRWNFNVEEEWDRVLVRYPTAADYDFYWHWFEHFPHPTFQGEGSMESYRTFAFLLLRFLEEGDNFDYLAEHSLFDLPLVYEFDNGDSSGSWTFREFVNGFSSDTGDERAYYADEDTRNGLKEFAIRIEEAD
jgi:hypothetical protein